MYPDHSKKNKCTLDYLSKQLDLKFRINNELGVIIKIKEEIECKKKVNNDDGLINISTGEMNNEESEEDWD